MVRLLSLSDALEMLSDNVDVEPKSKHIIEADNELVGAESLRRAAQSVRNLRRQTA